MDKTEKKVKLIYCGELLVIAIVFFVIGLLELLYVIKIGDRFKMIFKFVTLAGAAWMIADFLWAFFSPKRRKKSCLLDKILLLPLAGYLIAYDIIAIAFMRPYAYYQIGIPVALFYIACVYIFESIYHYYHPIPMMIEAIEEEKRQNEKEKQLEDNKNTTEEK